MGNTGFPAVPRIFYENFRKGENNTLKNRITAIILLVAICLFAVPVSAERDSVVYADALFELGIFKGTDIGYQLDKTLTRAEAVTMIVRIIGKSRRRLSVGTAIRSLMFRNGLIRMSVMLIPMPLSME